jgi:hypothetical protein
MRLLPFDCMKQGWQFSLRVWGLAYIVVVPHFGQRALVYFRVMFRASVCL